MDQTTLVDGLKIDGQQVLDRLIEDGIPIAAAGWLRTSDDGEWFLYIATPLVPEDGGTIDAYSRVLPLIRGLSQRIELSPFDVKLIDMQDPIAQGLRELSRRQPGRAITRIAEGPFAGKGIDGAYVYPIPSPSSR